MYELVNKKQDGVQQIAPGTLMLPSRELQLLQTTSGEVQLYTQSNCSGTIQGNQQVRITSVSVVLDLKPDATLAVLGAVTAAEWTVEDAADLEAVRQSIETAGQGYIESPRSDWIQVGATRFAGPSVVGYTATQACEEQPEDASLCTCAVDLPSLYADSTSTTSLFRTSAVPMLVIDVLLRPCVPLQVTEAVKQVVSAHLPLKTAACARLMSTHVSGDPNACIEQSPQPPTNIEPPPRTQSFSLLHYTCPTLLSRVR